MEKSLLCRVRRKNDDSILTGIAGNSQLAAFSFTVHQFQLNFQMFTPLILGKLWEFGDCFRAVKIGITLDPRPFPGSLWIWNNSNLESQMDFWLVWGNSGSLPMIEIWTYFHDSFSSRTQKESREAGMWFLAPVPMKTSWECSRIFFFLNILEHRMKNKLNWQQTT